MPIASKSGSLHGDLAVEFANKVKQATSNRINLVVYPSGSLYQNDQVFGAVKNNLAPIGSRLVSALSHESKLFQLDSLPFLAKSYGEAFNLYKASKSEFERVLKIKGVKLLYSVPWPAQGMYSKVEIGSIDDLKGLKFRPYSKVTSQFGMHLGMQPVVFDLNVLKEKLKEKTIDVVFGSALSAEQFVLVDEFPYWYDLRAWLPKEIVFVNLSSWNKLSDQDKKTVQEIAKEIETLGWFNSKKADEAAKQYLIASGVSVMSPNMQLRKELESVGSSVIRDWLIDVGDRGRYILERYMK